MVQVSVQTHQKASVNQSWWCQEIPVHLRTEPLVIGETRNEPGTTKVQRRDLQTLLCIYTTNRFNGCIMEIMRKLLAYVNNISRQSSVQGFLEELTAGKGSNFSDYKQFVSTDYKWFAQQPISTESLCQDLSVREGKLTAVNSEDCWHCILYLCYSNDFLC